MFPDSRGRRRYLRGNPVVGDLRSTRPPAVRSGPAAVHGRGPPDRPSAVTDREGLIQMLERRADLRGQLLPGRVIEVKEYGDKAAVHLNRPDPTDRSPFPAPTSVVSLTRHGERWCLSHGGSVPE